MITCDPWTSDVDSAPVDFIGCMYFSADVDFLEIIQGLAWRQEFKLLRRSAESEERSSVWNTRRDRVRVVGYVA